MRSTSLDPHSTGTRAPAVWVLADDRPGHRTQVVGLADSLGWQYEVKELRFGPLNLLSNRLLGASLLGLDRARSSKLAAPWPDLVIAMGRRAAPVARWIGAQGGPATRLVQLGRKGADTAEEFDLSITCAHFRLPPHPRRLITAVPITQVTGPRLQAAGERWQGLFKGPQPHIAVMVGGPTAQHRLDEAVAAALARDALGFAAATGGTLHFITSRRTAAPATAAIRQIVGTDATVHEWTPGAEANPYLGYLALADVLIVTGESESMLAEAAAAGKVLYVYPIPAKSDTVKRRVGERAVQMAALGGVAGDLARWVLASGLVRPPRRLEEMHAALYRAGVANRFGVPLAEAACSALPETVEIVARVRAVVMAADAPRQQARRRTRLAARFGFVDRSNSRTFWFMGSDPDDFANAAPLMEALRERYPRVRVLLITDRRDTAERLAASKPESWVMLKPVAAAGAARRMVKRLNPRLMILLNAAADDGAVIAAAARRHVPVLMHCPAVTTARTQSGVVQQLAPGASTDEMLATIAPLMRRDLKQLRSQSSTRLHPKRLATAVLHSRPGQWIAGRRHRRIDTIDELRVALGRPRTILCLGNGPSCEDPRLRELPYDCVFRTNDRWISRGFLENPDMVFTGDRGTVARVRGVIFGFQDQNAADRLLLQRALGLLDPPLRFVTVDGLGTFLDTMDLPATPTNGSTMLATAVALAPDRLIIAGIDLFMDPRGGYPGDKTTANAYTPRHDRDVEVRIIKRALESFPGEVTIVSEVLRRTLAREGSAKPDDRGAEQIASTSPQPGQG